MVLILQHVPFEGPGLIAEMMEGRGLPCKAVEVFEEGVPFCAAGCSGVVSMGGPMSVLDGLDVIEKEKRLLLDAVKRGLPVLGVCLGAQILASACGARVYPGSGPEVGWGQVGLTEEGLSDPLFSGVQTPLPVLHWHGDTFDLPPGAAHLAFSDRYPHQAFRVGGKAYGFQFHLEVDEAMVREWVASDPGSEGGLLDSPEEVTGRMAECLGTVRFGGSMVFGRFLDLVARES